eukprot:CAMPEP_0184492236 /NCGR_PEP_ID=MMETSP0113_2-20130426/22678_1 /TAXON_ID=91329 /ORGANISM="Norrisiella sphaerica, Strain BC52" /LENGTH=45 /DNA_ID= /DNA_START= /DNA_END= /DNA_ORIENTATION=
MFGDPLEMPSDPQEVQRRSNFAARLAKSLNVSESQVRSTPPLSAG